MTLVVQSFRQEHNYGLESIYLLRTLYSNYRETSKQTLPTFIDSKIAVWKFSADYNCTWGYRFLIERSEIFSQYFQHMALTLRLANDQLQNWRQWLSKGSLMDDLIVRSKNYEEKSWRRLELLGLHFSAIKHVCLNFAAGLNPRGSKDKLAILEFSHDVMVEHGRTEVACVDLVFHTCLHFFFCNDTTHQPSPQLDATLAGGLQPVWDDKDAHAFGELVSKSFERAQEDGTLAKKIVVILLSAYSLYFHRIQDNTSVSIEKIAGREYHQRDENIKLSKDSQGAVWWHFVCSQATMIYLRYRGTRGFKKEVVEAMGLEYRERSRKRKIVDTGEGVGERETGQEEPQDIIEGDPGPVERPPNTNDEEPQPGDGPVEQPPTTPGPVEQPLNTNDEEQQGKTLSTNDEEQQGKNVNEEEPQSGDTVEVDPGPVEQPPSTPGPVEQLPNTNDEEEQQRNTNTEEEQPHPKRLKVADAVTEEEEPHPQQLKLENEMFCIRQHLVRTTGMEAAMAGALMVRRFEQKLEKFEPGTGVQKLNNFGLGTGELEPKEVTQDEERQSQQCQRVHRFEQKLEHHFDFGLGTDELQAREVTRDAEGQSQRCQAFVAGEVDLQETMLKVPDKLPWDTLAQRDYPLRPIMNMLELRAVYCHYCLLDKEALIYFEKDLSLVLYFRHLHQLTHGLVFDGDGIPELPICRINNPEDDEFIGHEVPHDTHRRMVPRFVGTSLDEASGWLRMGSDSCHICRIDPGGDTLKYPENPGLLKTTREMDFRSVVDFMTRSTLVHHRELRTTGGVSRGVSFYLHEYTVEGDPKSMKNPHELKDVNHMISVIGIQLWELSEEARGYTFEDLNEESMRYCEQTPVAQALRSHLGISSREPGTKRSWDKQDGLFGWQKVTIQLWQPGICRWDVLSNDPQDTIYGHTCIHVIHFWCPMESPFNEEAEEEEPSIPQVCHMVLRFDTFGHPGPVDSDSD